MSKLVISELQQAAATAKGYESTVTESFYNIYKRATVLSGSPSFQGESADQFKWYMGNVTVNIVNAFLNTAREITNVYNDVLAEFTAFESSASGHVDDETLEWIKGDISSLAQELTNLVISVNSVYSSAASYIGVSTGAGAQAHSALMDSKSSLDTVSGDLATADTSALAKADALLTMIQDLKQMVQQTGSFCSLSGKDDYAKLPQIENQSWYVKQDQTDVLSELMEKDPFAYEFHGHTVAQDQWAAGWVSDCYAYAGYKFSDARYSRLTENGKTAHNAGYTLFGANGYAQFTDYASIQGNVTVGDIQGDLAYGWSDKYKGFNAEASATGAKADATAVIGPSCANIYGKAEASAATASAFARAEYVSEDEWSFGAGFEASAASAEAKVGFSLFEVECENGEGKEKEKVNLLCLSASASANAGGGAKVAASSKPVYDGDWVDVNAVSVDLSLKVLGGIDLSFTVPTIDFDWGW